MVDQSYNFFLFTVRPPNFLIASYALGLLLLLQKKIMKTQKIQSAIQPHLCQIPKLMTATS